MAVNINNNDQQSSHPACAACRYQRKKCVPNCLLRRHFPASNSDGFAAVHKVFGVANVIKMMREAESLADQDELARSLHWEAAEWARDPVRGPYGAFALLQDENRVLREQLNRQRMILLHNTPMLPPPPINNNNSNNFHRNMPADNYYIPQQMPMSFSAPVNRQFQGQRSMTKEDYDGLRVSGNGIGPESNVRVTSNNLSWQRNQQQQQHYTSSQHDYKMR